ncbi:uncharacterized protein BN580_01049 [Candidatus Colimorpha enterica]|uniref:Uncharacterized protein n=1 Tax=Candidatus Colimorpha enterica TaxID=3083063 RepID=R6TK68_9BACT|nr:uncharacterized protein BN580_01049 [Candidatus Colimorpha enterica]
MTGHEPDEIFALYLTDILKQIGKRVVVVQSPAVGIDILTEKSYLPAAVINKPAHLGKDLLASAAPLASSDVRNDAVCAEIVATVHYADPCSETALASDGQSLRDNGHGGLIGIKRAFSGLYRLCKILRQFFRGSGSEKKIDVRVAVLYIVQPVLLRHHTAADADDKLRICRLYVLYLSGQRQCLKLRVLSHGAGIENDKSGIFGRVREFISHDDRHSGKSFAVRLVLLTAEGLYVYPRFMSVLCLICKAVFKHKPSRGCVQYIFSHFRLLTTGRPVPTFYHYIIPHFCHGVNCNVPNFSGAFHCRRATAAIIPCLTKKRSGYAPGSGFSAVLRRILRFCVFRIPVRRYFCDGIFHFRVLLLLLVVS